MPIWCPGATRTTFLAISSGMAPFDKLMCPVFPRYVRCEHHFPARPSTPCCGHKNPQAQLADENRPWLELDLFSPRVCVCDCSASPSDRPVQPPAFGVRPGFTCAPYWDVLTGDISDCYDSVLLLDHSSVPDVDDHDDGIE